MTTRELANVAYSTARTVGAKHLMVTTDGTRVFVGCERARDVAPMTRALASHRLLVVSAS